MGDTNSSILESYSIQSESKRLLTQSLLGNPRFSSQLPPEARDFASRISFKGSPLPTLAINWRFAESASSLKGLEACLISALVKRKYGARLKGAHINTDHAQLFFMSAFVWTIDPDTDRAISLTGQNIKRLDDLFPNYDFHQMSSSLYRQCATGIYRTKDNRYFQLHGSMNPDPTLNSIDLPLDRPDLTTWEDARQPFIERMVTIDAKEMQRLASDVYKQAGVICETVDSFRATEHGMANADVGLFRLRRITKYASHKPCWWPDTKDTSPRRPLAGLKVLDLTRVIAAPAVTRGLAELGASVMRVTSPNIADFTVLAVDMSWGKWQCSLDLTTDEGKMRLKDLIREADVVVQGYRPGVLDKYGFSQDAIIDLVRDRERGIVSIRSNTYGWDGPWSHLSGWQQISDACVGISAGFGRAMGLHDNEAVTPIFPNSDYMVGIAGVVAVLSALIEKAENGGSYNIDLSLNYYNQWLADEVGEYSDQIWQDLWDRNGRRVFRSYHGMNYSIREYFGMILQKSSGILLNPSFFEDRESKAIGSVFRTVRPIIKFDDEEVLLSYNVGTRGNGKDAPKWPEDLMTEIVV
ncbi:uncharacterized protein A1O9_04350 [Exophiala aquamarina CBS 119918]|uniref:Alpha-methylacyl-CoA racemase n=1 Tax=Exophiala aquamarina CBS 119918 TaxID=1182545 RepID=A0A072PHZ8_9EURO|nr:uncharacterized protein A1O9_04350 [Exophiala aquamarina CBS 119918]KEF59506.1 hypothetical protein A1O9_04350 [Exophiala aquamarina CBS 119918]